jgi:hypothetical protein
MSQNENKISCSTLIAIIGLIIAIVAFVFGDNLYQQITGRSFFTSVQDTSSVSVPTASKSPNPPPPFFNEWINTDTETGGVRRISIKAVNGETQINMFGACSPTDCDWLQANPVVIFSYDVEAETLNIQWDFGFEVTTQELILLPDGRLQLTSHDHFTDNSGRLDFDSVEYFVRQ